MLNEKQKYVLTSRHQLIDLNKNFKNFKLQFQVVSTEPNKDFHAIVLNQEQLDGGTDLDKIEMKLAKGKIGGTIVADNDKYQNYFLVLKSITTDDNLEVEVSTSLEEIEPKQRNQSAPESHLPEIEKMVGEHTMNEGTQENLQKGVTPPVTPAVNNPSVKKTSLWKNPWLWILVLTLVGAGFYYYFYVHRAAQPLKSCPIECIPPVMDAVVPDLTGVGNVPVVHTESTPVNTIPSTKRRGSSKQQLYKELAEIA